MDTQFKITWENIKSSALDGHITWLMFFDDRQRKEIEFSLLYAKNFSHGTDGHNAKILIARLVEMLNEIAANVEVNK